MSKSEYVIDHDVPLTKPRHGKQVYPFPDMEVGDSFETDMASVSSAATNWGKNNNAVFTVRKLDDGKYRCWRIA